MTEQPDDATGVFVEEALEDDVLTHADPESRSHGESSMDVSSRRWLRGVAVVAVVVIVVALAVVIYGAVRHRDNQETDARTAASVAAARDWVNLFVTANDDTVVARADEITARTGDPLHADAMNRIEPYLEQIFDDGSGHPLHVTSAAAEQDGVKAGRPPLPAGATTVLVTTTARSEKLGHGYALWVYVVDDGGPKIAEFGGVS